jgi:hypothetical protein
MNMNKNVNVNKKKPVTVTGKDEPVTVRPAENGGGRSIPPEPKDQEGKSENKVRKEENFKRIMNRNLQDVSAMIGKITDYDEDFFEAIKEKFDDIKEVFNNPPVQSDRKFKLIKKLEQIENMANTLTYSWNPEKMQAAINSIASILEEKKRMLLEKPKPAMGNNFDL